MENIIISKFEKIGRKLKEMLDLKADKEDIESVEEKLSKYRPTKFSNFKKLGPYLSEFETTGVDYDYCLNIFDSKYKPSNFGCSEVRVGSFLGRNFDLTYSENEEFVIHVKADGKNVKYNSISISTNTNINEADVLEGLSEDDMKLLPFLSVDGINEKGLCAALNVVPIPTDSQNSKGTNNGEGKSYPFSGIIRYTLDNFATAAEVKDFLQNDTTMSWYQPHAYGLDFEYHAIISDKTESIIVEMVDREIKVVENADIMTNFHVSQFEYNDYGEVIIPPYRDENGQIIKYDDIINLAEGTERYNYARNILTSDDYQNSELGDKYWCTKIMTDLYYTNAYKGFFDEDNQFYGEGVWLSEFVTKDRSLPGMAAGELSVPANVIEAFYKHRSRNPESLYYGTWHTEHSTIYDLENKVIYFRGQEGTSVPEIKFKVQSID